MNDTPAKPKREFRMKQPTKDELRAKLAAAEKRIAELEATAPAWWRRMFRRNQ